MPAHPPEAAQPENPLDYLVHVRKVALPLFPQLGLEPNAYYIPPIHVPGEFLRQMFGPGAEAAAMTYRGAAADPDLSGLLALFGSSEKTLPRWQRYAPARALGNQMAGPRKQPVQDLVADGPGTLRPAKRNRSIAAGRYLDRFERVDGRWRFTHRRSDMDLVGRFDAFRKSESPKATL